jgi:hypothetical protein
MKCVGRLRLKSNAVAQWNKLYELNSKIRFEVAYEYIALYKFYVLKFTVIYKSEIFLGRQVIILPKYLISYKLRTV